MEPYLLSVIAGTIVGSISRIVFLQTDFRQYPTYPTGRIIHLSFGMIAAFIGAVSVPAVLESDWTAVTFLGLAATQFREIRTMERETLEKVDEKELVKRGEAFIEGMAQAFEGRNYLVMFVALITSLGTVFHLWLGVVIGIVAMLIAKRVMKGKYLCQMATIEEGNVYFQGADVYVDDILIKNIGLQERRDEVLRRAIGVIVIPNNMDSVITLSHLGQRQAMLHHVANILGSYLDTGEADLIPLTKRDMTDGRIALFMLPHDKDYIKVEKVLEKVPILDSAMRLPSKIIK